MHNFYVLVCLALLTPIHGQGQIMSLQNGTMEIGAGTIMELMGPIEFQIATGAEVTNHGLIELGSMASISEPVNGPINGTGTEHAVRDLPSAFANNNIAGLGLVLSLNNALGQVEVTRGHEPLFANGTTESIARWYRLQADPLQSDFLDITFAYDPTELNGFSPLDLVAHKSMTNMGSWLALPSTPNVGQSSVSTSDTGPWEYLTLFPEIINVAVQEFVDMTTFSVYPTASDGQIQISAKGREKIIRWELFSATGQLLANYSGGSSLDHSVIDLSAYHSGPLVLRINDAYRYRLVKL